MFLPLLLLLAALAIASCGGATEPTARPETTGDPGATAGATGDDGTLATDEPAPIETDAPDPAETDEPDPAETDEPEPAETDEPEATEDASGEPTASSTTGSAASCAGNDENRAFFAAIAAAVDWPVYCPVLPGGWFVATGRYQLAGGGSMTITYRGPDGARLQLGEGAFCAADDGCVPAGPDAGAAAFGDLAGTRVSGDDGSHAVVVDRNATPSWVAVGTGLDVDAFTGIVANLTRVDD